MPWGIQVYQEFTNTPFIQLIQRHGYMEIGEDFYITLMESISKKLISQLDPK